MSIIKVENLSFAYPNGSEDIFKNVNFQIDTDWKLGFVGRNGRGKTTFLRLLMGKYEYSGRILSSVDFDYFPYEITDKSRLTLEIMQEICPQAEDWEFIRELSLLDLDAEVLYRSFGQLSNGEQTKVMLAALFLNDGRFLLIDEPTNHLDAAGRDLVSSYLNRKKGFILVSHDRRFLDGCVDHILSLNKTDIEVQSGNFSSWMTNYQRQMDMEMRENQKLEKDISRLRQAAGRTAGWSDRGERGKFGATSSGSKVDRGYVGHKAEKMMKRSKTLEKRQQKAIADKSSLLKNLETAEDLLLFPKTYRSDTLITFRDFSPVYDDSPVCEPLTFEIRNGDRIALDGKNGCGKSSVLKILVQKCGCPELSVPADLQSAPIRCAGSMTAGSGIKVSYVPQDTSLLRGSLVDLADARGIDQTLLLAVLRKLDFDRSLFSGNMEDYSGGQKKKVLIAASLCEQAHLYIWDEPLNFIDIYSRMQIEDLILKFSPTMIFVEHDRAFREKIATKIVSLEKTRKK